MFTSACWPRPKGPHATFTDSSLLSRPKMRYIHFISLKTHNLFLSGPLSLDPNSSLLESSSGGLPCSADSAADRRQTDLGYSGTVWNKWSETGDVECLTTAVIYTDFRTASKVLGVGGGEDPVFEKGGGNR
ncbi:hypothetical protein CEXT_100001 [Caerostris extrusa]|uniref:Uncharacterized protein n=1 Tax=Caerostris extrusa TaxID=172846 RepID=A0AAV4XF51_CAEEX|nr:hypothetical protein CEXT_100001 [Caerostris extrusa]